MARFICAVSLSLLLALRVSASHAAIRNVPSSQYPTIQAGLDSCATGDTVLVAPGTYSENLMWPTTQGINLLSELGSLTTVIDGGGIASVVTMVVELDTTTIINGFTIQNGIASLAGGGILCHNSCSPTIADNIIRWNSAPHGGGVAIGAYSSPVLVANRITDNTADSNGGGVIAALTSSPVITGNTIDSNSTLHEDGGGIACTDSSSAVISNNEVTANTAWHAGGGIKVADHATVTITECTIAFNKATKPNAKAAAIKVADYATALIRDCTIQGNEADSMSGGIRISDSSTAIVIGNTITGNVAGHGGGGITCSEWSVAAIDSNTIERNEAQYGGGILLTESSKATIADNVVSDNDGGIHCVGPSPAIANCVISGNVGDGVHCEGSASPVITCCDIFDNTEYGVRNIDPSVTVNAEFNWWGDPSGPGGAGSGSGDEVSDFVDYEPFLTQPGCQCDCPFQSDFDEDGFLTALDLGAMIDILFSGAADVQDPPCPTTRADFDCDGFSTALDLGGLIDHLFAAGPPPCDPCN